MDVTIWYAVGGILFGAISEIIALNPKWESNSIIQLCIAVGKKICKG